MPIFTMDGIRAVEAKVSGRTALTVAKLYKVGERLANPKRLKEKDVADIYRLLQAAQKGEIPSVLATLREQLALVPIISQAREYLEAIFTRSDSVGFAMLKDYMESPEEAQVAESSMQSLVSELLAAWPS